MSRDHCDVGGHTAFHQRIVLKSAHQQHRNKDNDIQVHRRTQNTGENLKKSGRKAPLFSYHHAKNWGFLTNMTN